MKLKSIITVTFAALLLVGCQEEIESQTGVDEVVAITTSMNHANAALTRNGVQGDNYLGENLSLSIYTANSKYQYHNTLWAKNDLAWSCSEGQLLWEADTKTVNIYAYAPPISTGADDLTQLPVDVKTDQSTAEAVSASDLVGFTAIDQTVGSLLVNKMLPIAFTHRMAKLKVVLTFGAEFAGTVPVIESVEVQRVKCTGFYNAQTGEVTSPSNTLGKIETYCNTATAAYEAIILPQSIAGGTRFIRVNLLDGRAFSFSVPTPETYDFTAPNSEYTLTLRVGKDKLEVASPVTVAPWTDTIDLGQGDVSEVYKTTIDDFSAATASTLNKWIVTGSNMTNMTSVIDAIRNHPYALELSMPDITTVNTSQFSNCNKLISLSLPNATQVGEDAFANCIELTSLYLGISANSNVGVNATAFKNVNTNNISLFLSQKEVGHVTDKQWRNWTFKAITVVP